MNNNYGDIISRMLNKKYTESELNVILPKLSMICNKFNIVGTEVIDMIELLINFKKMNRLELVNEESLDFINYVFTFQKMIGMPFLRYHEIMKHILTPHQLNKCDDEKQVYLYQIKIEFLMAALEGIVAAGNNFRLFLSLGKYNDELYNLSLLMHKCGNKLRDNNVVDRLTVSSLTHMFGVFYFNQEKYNKDSQILEEIVDSMIDNPSQFKSYCENAGVVAVPQTDADWELTYLGIIDILDSAYKKKNEEKREK